jgi:hypothetical protein
VPFAVLDVLSGLGVILVAYRGFRLLQVVRQRGLPAAMSEGLRRGLRLVSLLIVVFFVVWGFNYRRQPLEAALPDEASARARTAAVVAAFDGANALAGRLRRAVMAAGELSLAQVAEQLREPMAAALVELKRPLIRTPSRPKHAVFVQPFFERAGYDGMVNPLALETILHRDLLPYERPFVLAHEWGHLAGHADEAEASAVGWLACMKGGPEFAYSASLYLIMQTQRVLPPDDRRKALGRLHPGVREDLAAIADRLTAEDPRVQRAAERVYDEYLRANRVADGTASYGRALQIILSEPFQDALRFYR